MRILVTGAHGFVGTWLIRSLVDAGHDVVALATGVDVTRREAVLTAFEEAAPDAVAHLAAVAFGPDATADPERAFAVNVGGTINVLEAVRRMARPAAVLVTCSSEVYGAPAPQDLPLRESSPLDPRTPYALSKAGQEAVALSYAARFGLAVVVTRSFNHTGPGQRPPFVVPTLAERVLAVASGQATDVPVGNLDVMRDVSDVRDVVDAYRRLLELAPEARATAGIVVNVCSGHSVSIRWIAEELCRLAGISPVFRVDPGLVRAIDTPNVRGDPSLIERLTGWRTSTPLTTTLADVWAATKP